MNLLLDPPEGRLIQQKISGTFRTETGARRFAALRSSIETGRNHAENPIDLLSASSPAVPGRCRHRSPPA